MRIIVTWLLLLTIVCSCSSMVDSDIKKVVITRQNYETLFYDVKNCDKLSDKEKTDFLNGGLALIDDKLLFGKTVSEVIKYGETCTDYAKDYAKFKKHVRENRGPNE